MTRIPSTSDLCHAQSNKAYDKLAVISENIEELEALYNFIFDIQEYFRQTLKNYVHLHNDQTIDSIKTFTKPPRVQDINFYNVLDELDNIVNITTVYDDNNPCFDITLKRRDMEEQVDIIGNIRLKLNLSNNTPVFEAIDTVSSDEQSVVVVKYLNQVVSNLNALISALDIRVTNLENAVNILSDRITSLESGLGGLSLLDTVTEDSDYPVKSHGIYSFVKAIETELRSLISSSVGGIEIPVGSKTQKGILQVGDGINVSEGTISVNSDFIVGLVEGSAGGNSTEFNGVSGWRIWTWGKIGIIHVPEGAVGQLNLSQIKTITLPLTYERSIVINFVSSDSSGSVGIWNYTLEGNSLTVQHSSNSVGSDSSPKSASIDIIGWIA